MKSFLMIILILLGLSFASLSFAEAIPPTISNNVHVLKNTTASQCPTSWRGSADAADVTTDSGDGVSNGQIASGILSCDGCAFDQSSNDCVCKSCYGDYN